MVKQNFLTKMLLLMLMLVGSVSASWATETLVFSEDFEGGALPKGWSADAKGGGSVNGASIIQSQDVHEGEYCWKLGTNNNPYGSVTTCALGFTGDATLKLWARGKKSTSPELIVSGTGCTIDGTNTVTINGNTYTQFTFTLKDVTATATLTFKHNGPSGAGSYIYIDDIEITQVVTDDKIETTTTIDDSGITYTDVYTNTAAGSLSATVTETESGDAVSGATVTWSSSNTGVATIDASTGAVTLVAKGTTTITASYAGNATYQSSSDTYELTVTSSAPVVDYATLPFNWAGGASATFKEIDGLTLSGNGSDYDSNSHSPYLIKFDDTGDYIQIKTDSQPGKVTIGVKMIGGSKTSTIKVQGSSDGETFTDVEELTISGAQYDELTLETTNAFAATDRYVRLLFTKGSNVGVGPISIAKPTNDPVINAESTINLAADATSGEISYTISNSVDGTSLTASVEDGCDWISNVTVEAAKVTFTATANDGEERSAVITLTYGEVTKNVTVIQAKVPFTITDGVFDFTQDEDYGSGLKQSGVKVQTSTWTAVNVTMEMTGRNCWYNNNPDQIRLYKASGDDAAGSITLSVPDGSVITNIAFTGASLGKMSPDDENCSYNSTISSATWEGVANSVTFTASDRTDIETITVTYVSMPASATVNIPDSHYGTYCSEYALDFSESGVDAYTAAYVESEGKVVLTLIADGVVPANTGVVLYSETTGEQDIPTTTTTNTIDVDNEMVGVTAQTAVPWTVGDKYNYILQQGKFKKATGASLRANRAYLSTTYNVNGSVSGAPELDLVFGDETTGIQNIERTVTDNQYYTLDGRRVAQPTKGLYIVNGKKVVIK